MRKALSIAVMVVSAFTVIGLSGTSAFAEGGDATNTNCSGTTVTIDNGATGTTTNSGDSSTSTSTDGTCPTTTTTPVTPGQGEGTPAAPTTTPAATTPAPAPAVLPYTAGPSPLARVIATVAATAVAGSALLFFGVRALRR